MPGIHIHITHAKGLADYLHLVVITLAYARVDRCLIVGRNPNPSLSMAGASGAFSGRIGCVMVKTTLLAFP